MQEEYRQKNEGIEILKEKKILNRYSEHHFEAKDKNQQ